MAHIREVMAMGVASPLARMLGSNRQTTVIAGGSSQDDATPLIVNYALIQSLVAGGGVRLGPATGSAIAALYNSGPAAVNLYPAEDDAFQDQAPNLPLALAPGQSALAVPSIDRWIVSLQGAGAGGGIAEAPSDGSWYGRHNAAWSPVLGLDGGTMTGALTLAGDPAAPMQPATKNYVDLLGGLVAPRNSPTFTGVPRAPTAALADNSTQIATTAYVQAQGYLTAIALAGDLAGSGASPLAATVVGLQGRALSAAAPANGQVLGWSAANNNWAPIPAPPAAAGGSPGQLQWNSAGSLAGLVMAGDATLDTASGNLTLIAVNPNIGTFQGLSIDGKGRVIAAANMNYAPLASPLFTGAPTAPTPATGNNSTALATTAFVKAQGYLTANQAITLSGDASGTGATAIPVTLAAVNANIGAFQGLTVNAKGLVTAAVNMNYAPLASPAFTGAPTAPSPATADNSTALATTAFVKAQGYPPVPVSVANGGTGLVSGTSGGIPYYSAAGTMASSAQLAANALIAGGGAGAAPASATHWSLPGGAAGTLLLVNANAAAAPAASFATGMQIVGADGGNAAFQGDSTGGGSVYLLGRAAGGTAAAPAPTPAGQIVLRVSAGGYDGTAYRSNAAAVDLLADENWSATARGTRLAFWTTPDGTTAAINNMQLANDGGLSLPASALSHGSGTVTTAAPGGFYVGSSAVASGLTNSALRLNLTTAGLALPGAGGAPTVQLAGADNGVATVIGEGFGTGFGLFVGRQTGGTSAAPAATAGGQPMARFAARGYDTTWLGVDSARVEMVASETFSTAGHGARLNFATTAAGTTTLTNRLAIEHDGGVMAPPNVAGGSPGPGAFNVSGGYYIGGVNVTPGQSAASQTATANPAGTTQTTPRMMGLAGAITLKFTGRAWVTITGDVFNATAGDGATIQLSYGTGTAPANGGALAGTQIGARVNYIAASTAEKVPFSLTALVTGLVNNTAYWLDAAVAAITGGTATIENTVISAREF
ncbi:MAG TPA: hypothetical protein VGF07_13150 [Stellaceae bacterium]|jgi:hypothetical protein